MLHCFKIRFKKGGKNEFILSLSIFMDNVIANKIVLLVLIQFIFGSGV
jgi:hypothetical protein